MTVLTQPVEAWREIFLSFDGFCDEVVVDLGPTGMALRAQARGKENASALYVEGRNPSGVEARRLVLVTEPLCKTLKSRFLEGPVTIQFSNPLRVEGGALKTELRISGSDPAPLMTPLKDHPSKYRRDPLVALSSSDWKEALKVVGADALLLRDSEGVRLATDKPEGDQVRLTLSGKDGPPAKALFDGELFLALVEALGGEVEVSVSAAGNLLLFRESEHAAMYAVLMGRAEVE